MSGYRQVLRRFALAGLASGMLLLTACSTVHQPPSAPAPVEVKPPPQAEAPPAPEPAPQLIPAPSPKPAPRVEQKPNLDAVPEPVPREEPIPSSGNQPYMLFGRMYTPMTAVKPYRERGLASWYGRPFHGRKTANGERYDMYRMMAAHPTLPLPSFARVTNLRNGKSVIVRVNDRGPYKHGRAIDLSMAAAHRLDFLKTGTAEVEIELITVNSSNSAPLKVASPL